MKRTNESHSEGDRELGKLQMGGAHAAKFARFGAADDPHAAAATTVRERSECNTHSTSRRQFHRPSTAMRRRALHNVKLVLE